MCMLHTDYNRTNFGGFFDGLSGIRRVGKGTGWSASVMPALSPGAIGRVKSGLGVHYTRKLDNEGGTPFTGAFYRDFAA